MKESTMKRYLLIGLVCGTLALAGGVALAGPSFERSATIAAAQATPAPTAQPDAPNPGSNRGPRQGDAQHSGRGKGQRLGMLLGRATADVAGITQRDVLAGLNDGKSLAQIAQEHGKTADDVIKAARAKLEERLKQAVADGKLTQERADATLTQFDQAAPQIMTNQNLGAPARRGVGKRNPAAARLVQATAEVTGLEAKDVLAELQAGKSLAQIAQEHGKTADDILAKLREQGQQRLDKALDKAKELIDEPGLGGDQAPEPSPTAEPST
jgi:uncharacterized protein (DUF433 family)